MAIRKRRNRKSRPRRKRKLGLATKVMMRVKNLFTPSGLIVSFLLMLIPFLFSGIKSKFEPIADTIKSKTGLDKMDQPQVQS